MIYYCVNENNTCEKKDSCARFAANRNPQATLFKQACTEDNNYILYIKIGGGDENGQKKD